MSNSPSNQSDEDIWLTLSPIPARLPPSNKDEDIQITHSQSLSLSPTQSPSSSTPFIQLGSNSSRSPGVHNPQEYQPSNSDIDLKATEYQPESSGINYPLSTIGDQMDTIPKLCFVEAAIAESRVEKLPTRYFLNEPPRFFDNFVQNLPTICTQFYHKLSKNSLSMCLSTL